MFLVNSFPLLPPPISRFSLPVQDGLPFSTQPIITAAIFVRQIPLPGRRRGGFRHVILFKTKQFLRRCSNCSLPPAASLPPFLPSKIATVPHPDLHRRRAVTFVSLSFACIFTPPALSRSVLFSSENARCLLGRIRSKFPS